MYGEYDLSLTPIEIEIADMLRTCGAIGLLDPALPLPILIGLL